MSAASLVRTEMVQDLARTVGCCKQRATNGTTLPPTGQAGLVNLMTDAFDVTLIGLPTKHSKVDFRVDRHPSSSCNLLMIMCFQ